MVNYVQEKEQIYEQFELVKEILNKLRVFMDLKSDLENFYGVLNGELFIMNGESDWDGY